MVKFKKDINTSNRDEMIRFLSEHFRYNTARNWNHATSYANNAKIHNLGLSSELADKAYDFLSAECPEFKNEYNDICNKFREETNYAIGINGRSGYIVLYDISIGKAGIPYVSMKSIDMDADFETWTDEELKERTLLVSKFDEFCDIIISTFINYLNQTEIEEVTIMRPETHRIAKIKENDTTD